MSMGNFLRVEVVGVYEMAVKNDTVGMDHPTTVPANYEPDVESCPTCGKLTCEC
jgi:hypothetical protein